MIEGQVEKFGDKLGLARVPAQTYARHNSLGFRRIKWQQLPTDCTSRIRRESIENEGKTNMEDFSLLVFGLNY